MTSIENAREFRKTHILPGFVKNGTESLNIERLLAYHSKHVVRQVISFLEANEKKPIRAIINELKGKL